MLSWLNLPARQLLQAHASNRLSPLIIFLRPHRRRAPSNRRHDLHLTAAEPGSRRHQLHLNDTEREGGGVSTSGEDDEYRAEGESTQAQAQPSPQASPHQC